MKRFKAGLTSHQSHSLELVFMYLNYCNIFHATNTSSFALQVNLLDEEAEPGKHFFLCLSAFTV